MRTICSLIILFSLIVAPFTARPAFAAEGKSKAGYSYTLMEDHCAPSKTTDKNKAADCALHCSLCSPAVLSEYKTRIFVEPAPIKVGLIDAAALHSDALKGVFEPPKHA